MEKVYIVYLNKTYDVWAMDAEIWAEKNNLPTDNIISEVVFWHYMEEGLLDGKPVYFCKDIQQECLQHHLALNQWREAFKEPLLRPF